MNGEENQSKSLQCSVGSAGGKVRRKVKSVGITCSWKSKSGKDLNPETNKGVIVTKEVTLGTTRGDLAFLFVCSL